MNIYVYAYSYYTGILNYNIVKLSSIVNFNIFKLKNKNIIISMLF